MNLPDLYFLSVLDENPGLAYSPGPTIFEFVHTDHPRALLRAPNQVGKAQPVDEPVLTPTGWRRIGDLRPFDAVIAGDGSITYVVDVYPQGVRPVWRVEFDDGASTRCCDEHLWVVKTPNARFEKKSPEYQKWSVLPLQHIREKYGATPATAYRRCSIPVPRPVETRGGELPVEPYLLGLLIGDGSLSVAASVCLTTADAEIVEAARTLVPAGVEVRAGATYQYRLSGTGRDSGGHNYNPLLRSLVALGLMGCRSETKFVPDVYMLAPPPQRLALLQGLMDTDGTIGKNGSMSFTSTSPRLAEQVQALVRGLGGKAKIGSRITSYTDKHGQKRSGQRSYTVRIRLPGMDLFRIPRKRARRVDPVSTCDERVLYSITPAGEAECVCIGVAHPDHTYVTKDYIVTHNSLGGAKRADLASRGLLSCVPRVPNKGLVMIADLDNHYAEVCGKAWDVIDRPSLHSDCRYIDGKGFYTHGRRLVKYANGSTWTFRSGEGAVMAVAGGTFDWGWGDEIPNRPHFSEFMRGLAAKRAPAWLTLTPIGRPVDWYRERIEGDEEYRESEGKAGTPPREEWLQFVPRLSVEECPWRTQESIDTQIAGMDPAEVPQRRDGAWEGLAAERWFTGFGADSIVESVPRMSSCEFGVWMDHGENAGHEFVVLAVWRAGELYAIDEYVNPRATKPMDDAEAIVDMLAQHGLEWSDITSWVGDVNSAGKSEAGTSINSEIADAIGQITGHPKGRSPIRIDKPYKGPGSVQKRVRILHSAILKEELMVHRRCKRLIQCLGSHHGDEETKHGIDALGYGAVPVIEGWRSSGARELWLRGR